MNKRWLMRLLGLRIWEITYFTRKLKNYFFLKILKLENPVSMHSHVMIAAHHNDGGGISVGK